MNPLMHLLLFSCYYYYATTAWEKVHDERMPGELRVANEGLAHHDNHWYFSNQHFLYQATVQPINITISNHKAIPEELVKLGYNHIGDIDIVDGIIYSGIEGGSGGAYLAAWNATDLSVMKFKITTMSGMPWVACDVKTRTAWASEWNEDRTFKRFNIDTFEAEEDYVMPDGVVLPSEIQGT